MEGRRERGVITVKEREGGREGGRERGVITIKECSAAQNIALKGSLDLVLVRTNDGALPDRDQKEERS